MGGPHSPATARSLASARRASRSQARFLPPARPPPRANLVRRARRHNVCKQDRFLVLGSDGLFDVLTPKQVAKICAAAKNPQKAANDLMREATRKGSDDDTTVIVASLTILPVT